MFEPKNVNEQLCDIYGVKTGHSGPILEGLEGEAIAPPQGWNIRIAGLMVWLGVPGVCLVTSHVHFLENAYITRIVLNGLWLYVQFEISCVLIWWLGSIAYLLDILP